MEGQAPPPYESVAGCFPESGENSNRNSAAAQQPQQKVIIPKKKAGMTVNLEVDVIAKYVEQSLASVVARVEALEARLGGMAPA